MILKLSSPCAALDPLASTQRAGTFQSHFRAYKVNTHSKLFVFGNKRDFFFLPKGHLYP